MNILLKLFLAHLVGDFLLQPGKWVKAKEEKKLAAWQLYVHSILHGLLVLLFLFVHRDVPWRGVVGSVEIFATASSGSSIGVYCTPSKSIGSTASCVNPRCLYQPR